MTRAAFLIVCLIALSSLTTFAIANPHAGMPPAADAAGKNLNGKVSETMNSGGYTYILLDQGAGKKKWVAIPVTEIKVGQKVTIAPGIEMGNFTSKTLKRSFDEITFSSGLVDGAAASKPVVKTAAVEAAPATPIKVEKATGKNAYTVGEIFSKRENLANKPVRVRAQVVKVSESIMGTNWIHLRDGSGSAGSDDLVVTSKELPKVGAVVIASGKLSKDKDFGGGYRYSAIIEGAAFGK